MPTGKDTVEYLKFESLRKEFITEYAKWSSSMNYPALSAFFLNTSASEPLEVRKRYFNEAIKSMLNYQLLWKKKLSKETEVMPELLNKIDASIVFLENIQQKILNSEYASKKNHQGDSDSSIGHTPSVSPHSSLDDGSGKLHQTPGEFSASHSAGTDGTKKYSISSSEEAVSLENAKLRNDLEEAERKLSVNQQALSVYQKEIEELLRTNHTIEARMQSKNNEKLNTRLNDAERKLLQYQLTHDNDLDEFEKLKDEMHQILNENQRLNDELKELKEALLEKEEAIFARESELSFQENPPPTLETNERHVQTNFDDPLVDENLSLRKEIDKLEGELKALSKSLEPTQPQAAQLLTKTIQDEDEDRIALRIPPTYTNESDIGSRLLPTPLGSDVFDETIDDEQITTLKNENELLKKRLKEFQENLEKEQPSMRAKADKAQEDLTKANQAVTEAQNKLDALSKQHSEALSRTGINTDELEARYLIKQKKYSDELLIAQNALKIISEQQQELITELDEKTKEILHLQLSEENAERSGVELREQLATYKDFIDELNSDLRKLKASNDDKEADLNTLKAQLQSKEKELEDLQAAKKELDSQLATQSQKNGDLQSKLTASEQKSKQLDAEIAALKSKLTILEEDKKSNEEQIKLLKKNEADLAKDLQLKDNDVEELKSQLAGSGVKNARLQKKLKKAQAHSTQLNSIISELKKLLDEQNTRKKSIAKLTNRVSKLRTELASNEVNIQTLQDELRNEHQMKDALTLKLSLTSAEQRDLSSQIAILNKELTTLRDREKKDKETIGAQQGTIQSLTRKFNSSEKDIKSLERENKKLQDQLGAEGNKNLELNSELISAHEQAIDLILSNVGYLYDNAKLLSESNQFAQDTKSAYAERIEIIRGQFDSLKPGKYEINMFDTVVSAFNKLATTKGNLAQLSRRDIGTMTEQSPPPATPTPPTPNPAPPAAVAAAPVPPAAAVAPTPAAQAVTVSSNTHAKSLTIFASLEKIDIDTLLKSLKTKVVINFTKTELTPDNVAQFNKEGLKVHSPSGHEYNFQASDGGCKALLNEDQATKLESETEDEHQTRLAITMINMIDNVLAKSERISIQTSDPFMAEIARSYLKSLQDAQKVRPESCEISGNEANDNEKKVAKTAYDKLQIEVEYHNLNPAIKAREEMIQIREEARSQEHKNISKPSRFR